MSDLRSIYAAKELLEQNLKDTNDLYLARVLACDELWSEGWSLRRIGRGIGISHESVRRYLQDFAVDTSDKAGRTLTA